MPCDVIPRIYARELAESPPIAAGRQVSIGYPALLPRHADLPYLLLQKINETVEGRRAVKIAARGGENGSPRRKRRKWEPRGYENERKIALPAEGPKVGAPKVGAPGIRK